MTRSPNYCYQCGKRYTKKATEAFTQNGGFITCARYGCSAEWELPLMIKAILLQPGIVGKTGETGLVVVADNTGWTLPGGYVRINEGAKDTLARVAREVLGTHISPGNLHDFCTRHDPEERKHLAFYCHTTRLHEKREPSNEVPSLGSPKTLLIIQTTDGISFASPIYREVAEKFLLELWGRRPLF